MYAAAFLLAWCLFKIIPNPTDEYFAEIEPLKIDVVSECRDPGDF